MSIIKEKIQTLKLELQQLKIELNQEKQYKKREKNLKKKIKQLINQEGNGFVEADWFCQFDRLYVNIVGIKNLRMIDNNIVRVKVTNLKGYCNPTEIKIKNVIYRLSYIRSKNYTTFIE